MEHGYMGNIVKVIYHSDNPTMIEIVLTQHTINYTN